MFPITFLVSRLRRCPDRLPCRLRSSLSAVVILAAPIAAASTRMLDPEAPKRLPWIKIIL
ncbi:hypothetical protein OF001_U20161 [Pseudomonas sp. OF001]|nr:hypothetical protein OF001_U20161 [Pseudomonas sp. OF001]